MSSGNSSFPGIPPAKEIILGAVARLIKSRISDERSCATLLENLVIFFLSKVDICRFEKATSYGSFLMPYLPVECQKI